ncbi:hypothetical protein EJB05_08996, partial [Eragrostis curvula]
KNGSILSAHVKFNIENYKTRKTLAYATFVRSPTFMTLRYFPDGVTEEIEGHVSVALELMTANEPAWTLKVQHLPIRQKRSAWVSWTTVVQFNNENRFLFHWPE